MKRSRRTNLHLAFVFLVSFSEVGRTQVAVHDLPFSANEWITRTTTAANGSTTVTTQQIAIARASDGTVRREIHEISQGAGRAIGTPIIAVSILNLDTKANTVIFRGASAVTAIDSSRLHDISSLVATNDATKVSGSSAPESQGPTINGLRAIVHRSQYSVAASDPKGKAKTITLELWFSPDLAYLLKSTSSASDGTATVVVLDDIVRQEPDSALFRASTEVQKKQK